jgi:hypothetical protein
VVSEHGLGIEGDAGEALDAEARAQYRSRLADLEEDINEAEAHNDPERASRARREREILLSELGAAVGLGGHARRVLDPAERAPKAVTGRIRDAKNVSRPRTPSWGDTYAGRSARAASASTSRRQQRRGGCRAADLEAVVSDLPTGGSTPPDALD